MYLYSIVDLFFFNDTATTEIYTLSLHDALPIWRGRLLPAQRPHVHRDPPGVEGHRLAPMGAAARSSRSTAGCRRSEEHTSELQSRQYLVCRLLLEKKKQKLPNGKSIL